MTGGMFILVADIRTDAPGKIEPVLREFVGKGIITRTEGGFGVEAKIRGQNARDMNRVLLSSLRRVSKKTTLRAEWTHGKTTERFFDYVPKGIREE